MGHCHTLGLHASTPCIPCTPCWRGPHHTCTHAHGQTCTHTNHGSVATMLDHMHAHHAPRADMLILTSHALLHPPPPPPGTHAHLHTHTNPGSVAAGAIGSIAHCRGTKAEIFEALSSFPSGHSRWACHRGCHPVWQGHGTGVARVWECVTLCYTGVARVLQGSWVVGSSPLLGNVSHRNRCKGGGSGRGRGRGCGELYNPAQELSLKLGGPRG